MKKWIIYGREMEKLIREQRIRIERGDIIIAPLEEDSPVLEEAETVPETNSALDDKNIEMEDLKEVDLDDDKAIVIDDSKDVQEADAKEATSTKKDIQAY